MVNLDIPLDKPLTDEQRELAASCERMVVWVAKKRVHKTESLDDLVDAGYMGLIRAAQTYDATKGAFTTHASRNILAKVMRAKDRAIRDRGRKVDGFDLRNIPAKPEAEEWLNPDDVDAAFRSLPSNLQDVVRNRVWGKDGLTQIAKRLGCVKQTVLTREAKAFGILRDVLWRYSPRARAS